MAYGTDEDGARAAAMDKWVVWEAEERVAPGRQFDHLLLSLFSLCKGTHTPRLAHSAALRVEDLLCCGRQRGQ